MYCDPTSCTALSVERILRHRPQAVALIRGSSRYPAIRGQVRFYPAGRGTLVYAQIYGLPMGELARCERIFGFHIHEGCSCSGDRDEPFSGAKMHYNPDGSEHPYHAGDLPPLFASNGVACCAVLSGRFCVRQIIGRTVIIHADVDDFSSNSSGHAGERIACGVIRRMC